MPIPFYFSLDIPSVWSWLCASYYFCRSLFFYLHQSAASSFFKPILLFFLQLVSFISSSVDAIYVFHSFHALYHFFIKTSSSGRPTWRLKLSHAKTVMTAFHLNNREAKHELKVYKNDRLLPFHPTPTYLRVKLDRSLTFRHHLVALRKKLSSCVTLLRQLVGSGWGAGAKTLCIATLSLVYSTAEYCAPVWCRSAHTRLINSVLNEALHIITGCLHPTPMDHLPVFSVIQPTELHRMGATLSLAHCGSLDPDHILYGILSGSQILAM